MPCYTIQRASVDLSKAVQYGTDNVFAALQSLGLSPRHSKDKIRFGKGEWINVKTGESRLATFRDVDEIKRAVAKMAAMSQAKRFGWKVTEQADGKLLLKKATF